MAEIVSVHIASRTALTDDGRTLPITHLFDSSGDETDSEAEAVSFVAGGPEGWFACPLDLFERTATH